MKLKYLITTFFLVTGFTNILAAPNPGLYTPRATFDKIWVDYNVTESGQKGMRIHVKFTAYGMKDMNAYLAIYFSFNDGRGGVLRDKNGKFTSSTGDVALYKSMKPAYDPAVYNDMKLFMPYTEFDLASGNYQLKMDVKVIYQSGGLISKLTTYNFEYKNPEESISTTKPDAKFNNIWVDNNVTDNGKVGMRIHVNFTIYNMLGKTAYMEVLVQKSNDEKVYGVTNNYRNKDGQLSVLKSFTPNYKDSNYKDFTVFLPYDEIVISSGRHSLKLDVDVINTDGEIIKHLTYHNFSYTK